MNVILITTSFYDSYNLPHFKTEQIYMSYFNKTREVTMAFYLFFFLPYLASYYFYTYFNFCYSSFYYLNR